MARREGRTVDEMLEDMALVDFVIMRSFAECTREEVLAALAACDLADWEKAVVGKLIEQNVP
jgi:hypothetical protein